MTALIAGIDIGGTKIAAALVDPAEPTELVHYLKVETPSSQVIDTVVDVIHHLVEHASSIDATVASIGIGAPGVIDPVAGRVVSSGPTMAGWAGTEITSEVQSRCAIPTAVHNDVRIMGLGEATFGAGRRFERVLFISLGTGVGGALVSHGKLVPSSHFTAGELRSIIGRDPHGGAACVEDFASGPGIAQWYNLESGDNVQLPEIMNRYRAGEELAKDLINRCMSGLGEAIAGFATAIDVDAIVVGGGVGMIGAPIIEPFTHAFREHALSPLDRIEIVPAELGTNAPLIGAAHLAHLASKGMNR